MLDRLTNSGLLRGFIMKNIIFFSEEINLRAGGPAGYIANLKKGLQLIQNDRIFFIIGSKKIML